MEYSREDLLNLTCDLDDECLNCLPPNEPRTIGSFNTRLILDQLTCQREVILYLAMLALL